MDMMMMRIGKDENEVAMMWWACGLGDDVSGKKESGERGAWEDEIFFGARERAVVLLSVGGHVLQCEAARVSDVHLCAG